MANLYYNDGEGNMIQLANINSPMLTGNPITPTPSGKKNTQLVNVGYLKSYVSDKIKKYEFEYDDTQDYTITVTPLLKYMVSVYGVINSYSTTEQKKIGYVVVTDENDNILAKSASSVSALNLQQGYFPQSATMYVQAPPSGIFRAYVNYGGTDGKIKAQYILVVKADVTRTYRVNIIQSPNQTIEVIYNGIAFTESFEIVEGANYQVRITPHTGYNAGTLNTTGGTITGEDVEISATNAIKKKFTVNITQSAHQTIHVKHNGIDKTSTFTAEYGDEIEISISPDTGYNAGTVNPKGKITVSNNVSISATTAEIKKFTVSAQQFTEQTITMTRKDTNATTTTSWTNVPYNTQVTATIALKNDYKNSHTVGSLTASSKTITANYNFTATNATWKTYKLTIPKQSKQKITVKYTEPGASQKKLESTETAAKSVTVKYGTSWSATIASTDNDYNPGTLTPGTSGTVTAATTVSASTAQLKQGYVIAMYNNGNVTFTVPLGVNKVQVAFWWHYGSDERHRLGNGNTIADKLIQYQEEDSEGGSYWYSGYTGGEYTADTGVWNVDSRKTWWEKDYKVTETAVLNGKTYTEKPSCYIKVTPGKTYTIKARSGNYKGRANRNPPSDSCYCFIVIWSPEINNTTPTKIKSDL